MLTTNQVPFTAQVSVIPYSMGYESVKYLLCQVFVVPSVIQYKSRLII